MMDSKAVLYNKIGDDEAYTPMYGVKPILEYIKPNQVVWCPFDTIHSNYVKAISKTNKVIHSHIDTGKDFFEYQPDEWDVIISNPPFKRKLQFFKRALSLNKPFALLMTNTWLNDAAPKQLFRDIDLQLLMFDKRIRFTGNHQRPNDKITFSSSYYCCGFLPKQIIMKKLETDYGRKNILRHK